MCYAVLSHSVVSDSLRPHGLQPSRLFCPWDSPGKKLEWVVMPSSRGSFLPRDWTQVSCIAGEFFTVWSTREAGRSLDVYVHLIFTTLKYFYYSSILLMKRLWYREAKYLIQVRSRAGICEQNPFPCSHSLCISQKHWFQNMSDKQGFCGEVKFRKYWALLPSHWFIFPTMLKAETLLNSCGHGIFPY